MSSGFGVTAVGTEQLGWPGTRTDLITPSVARELIRTAPGARDPRSAAG